MNVMHAGHQGPVARSSMRRLSLILLTASTLMLTIEVIVFAIVGWQVLYPRHPTVLTAWTLGSGALAALASLIVVVARWLDAARARRSWR